MVYSFPPGARECLASCGQSVLAVSGWREHQCHWLALVCLTWIQMSICWMLCIDASDPSIIRYSKWQTVQELQGYPDPGLAGDSPRHYLLTHQELAQTLLGVYTGMQEPYISLSYIMSCCSLEKFYLKKKNIYLFHFHCREILNPHLNRLIF